MSAMSVPFRGRRFLRETFDGWRSEDGHHLRVHRGSYSGRMIGRLSCPDGSFHHFTTAKGGETLEVLDQAEDVVRQLRREVRP